MAAGQDSRAEVSRSARERLRDALRNQLDEVQVRLQEAILRADAHLLTGNSQGAEQALEDQRRLLGDLERRLESVLSDALVEREAEAVVADAASRLEESPEGQPSAGTAAAARSGAPRTSGPEGRSDPRRGLVGASRAGASRDEGSRDGAPAPGASTASSPDDSGRQLSAMLSAVMTIVAALTLALGGLTGADSALAPRGATLSGGTTADGGVSGAAGTVRLPVGSVEATSERTAIETSAADDGSWADRGYLGPTGTAGPRGGAPADPAGPAVGDHLHDPANPELPAVSGLAVTTSSDPGSVRPLGIRELVSGLLGHAAENVGAGDGDEGGSADADRADAEGTDGATGGEATGEAGSDTSPDDSDSAGLTETTVPELLPGADSGDEQTRSSGSTDDESRDGLKSLLGEDSSGPAPTSPPVEDGL